MRVVMACPYSLSRPGGVQGQALGLARALRTRGHIVTLIAPHDDYQPGTFIPDIPRCLQDTGSYLKADPPLEQVASFQGNGIFTAGSSMRVRANGSIAPIALSPVAMLRVVQLIRQTSPDVIHLHEPLAPLVNYAHLFATSVPIVGTFHRSGRSAWHVALRPAARWATSRLAARCAVSPAAAETTGSKDVEILFNGVEIERFSEAVPWPTQVPTVMFVGRHEKRKGLELLLRAFEKVSIPAVLWIAGDGPETIKLKRVFPPTARLHWLGALSEAELSRRLRGADVLCAPSLFGESFGVVLLEAMAARCAIVASALDGHRAAAGEHARLFPVGDQGALTNVLAEELAKSASRNTQWVDAIGSAFVHAKERSMSHLADCYAEIYGGVRG